MENNSGKKILLLDDEPEILKIIYEIFEENNLLYKIINFRKAKIALQILEKENPDLIITDWEMPEMDGIEFIKAIKRNKNIADIPIIMCTGAMTSSENLQTALNAGAADFIRKPIDKIELIARTKANLHLAENYNQIKQLNKIKNHIFSIISHDLRSPIGTIKSFIALLLENEKNFNIAQIFKYLATMKKQISSISDILENLLQWARSQDNDFNLKPQKQKLLPAITMNIELLEETAKQKKIKIINEINNEQEAIFDFNTISTVIRNLLSNAIKFTPENGKIYVEAKESNSKIIVSVRDTGIGISAERIKKLFDKTTYNSTFGTNLEKGTGLGLNLCRNFIEKHNEKIWVESEINKGSCFCFSLSSK